MMVLRSLAVYFCLPSCSSSPRRARCKPFNKILHVLARIYTREVNLSVQKNSEKKYVCILQHITTSYYTSKTYNISAAVAKVRPSSSTLELSSPQEAAQDKHCLLRSTSSTFAVSFGAIF